MALGEAAVDWARRERELHTPAKVNTDIAVPRLPVPTGTLVTGGVLPIPPILLSSRVCSCTCFTFSTLLGAARSLQHPLSPRAGAMADFGTILGTENLGMLGAWFTPLWRLEHPHHCWRGK